LQKIEEVLFAPVGYVGSSLDEFSFLNYFYFSCWQVYMIDGRGRKLISRLPGMEDALDE